MTNRIATLTPRRAARGVITLSAGNAGQAYAWAGRTAGVPVTVSMPAGAVRSKVEACLGYGARVVLHGAHVGETLAEMERIRDAEGLDVRPPVRRPGGHRRARSIGFELLEDLPDVDVVVVGVGGGGLISGVAAALKERRPAVRVYGVEPEGSNAVTHRPRTRTRSSASSRTASPTASARRSRASGRWRCAGATSTTSCCSTIRRSWPGCASRSSA